MKKVVVFYPYDTGKMPFSGGVAKVAVSNIIACHINGDMPYLVLPSGNTGLIQFVKDNYPYCEVRPVSFNTLALFSMTKNKWKRFVLIVKNTINHFKGRNALRKCLENIKPDVIHYHEIVCYNILHLYTDCKIVLHMHSYVFVQNRLVKPRVIRSINKYADVVIAPTKSIMEARSSEINNIVRVKTPYLNLSTGKKLNEDLAKELTEMKKNHVLFGYVGRICRIKRIDHFLKALSLLPEEKRTRVKYIIIGGCNTVGDQDYKKELESIINENGLQDNIVFVGYIDPIEAILPYIDYGAMLTESEAMPMVGVEYLKYGIPTIGYNAPGINDFVVDGEDGFLVNNGDIEDLSNNICRALEKPAKEFENSINAIFKGYSVESFAESLKNIY